MMEELNLEKTRTIAKHEQMERGSSRWAIMQLVMGDPVQLEHKDNEYYAMMTDCNICKFTLVGDKWVEESEGYELFVGCPGLLKFKRYTGVLYNNFPTVGQVVELVGNPVRIKVIDVTKSGAITGTIVGTKAKLSVKFGEYNFADYKVLPLTIS